MRTALQARKRYPKSVGITPIKFLRRMVTYSELAEIPVENPSRSFRMKEPNTAALNELPAAETTTSQTRMGWIPCRFRMTAIVSFEVLVNRISSWKKMNPIHIDVGVMSLTRLCSSRRWIFFEGAPSGRSAFRGPYRWQTDHIFFYGKRTHSRAPNARWGSGDEVSIYSDTVSYLNCGTNGLKYYIEQRFKELVSSSPTSAHPQTCYLPSSSKSQTSAANSKASRSGVPSPVTGSHPVVASHPAPFTTGPVRPEWASNPVQPTELPLTISLRPIEPRE